MSNIETKINFFTPKKIIYEVCMHILDTFEKDFLAEIKPFYSINIAYLLDIIFITMLAAIVSRRAIGDLENRGLATNTIQFDYYLIIGYVYV